VAGLHNHANGGSGMNADLLKREVTYEAKGRFAPHFAKGPFAPAYLGRFAGNEVDTTFSVTKFRDGSMMEESGQSIPHQAAKYRLQS
jgi:hypothetical protein